MKTNEHSRETESRPDYFYGYFAENLDEKNMSYIQALKKPTHNKAFSSDNAKFPQSNFPQIFQNPEFFRNGNENNEITEHNNDADLEEEQRAKINKSFSVEINENLTIDNNPSALYVGLKEKSEVKEKKCDDFLLFVNKYINYFEEDEKSQSQPSSHFFSTKKKNFQKFNLSTHQESKQTTASNHNTYKEEINNLFVLQNKKLLKSKAIIEELRKTQKTLVQEISDHQEREKAYINVKLLLFI